MTTHISSLGYDSTRVTRPLLNHGVDGGDKVVLLLPTRENEDRRAAEAIDDIERMLGELEPGIDIEQIEVQHTDFENAVTDCMDVLSAATGDVIVNFGGGPREVFLPFSVAVLAHLESVTQVMQFRDIDGAVSTIELPNLRTQIDDPGFEILRALEESDGGATVPDLTAMTDWAKSTIIRHVDHLEAARAVDTEMAGKTRYVTLAFTGRVLLRAGQ